MLDYMKYVNDFKDIKLRSNCSYFVKNVLNDFINNTNSISELSDNLYNLTGVFNGNNYLYSIHHIQLENHIRLTLYHFPIAGDYEDFEALKSISDIRGIQRSNVISLLLD